MYGKINVFPFTEAFFNHAVITARDWFVQGERNEPIHGGDERAYGYAGHHSPSKWEGRLAI